MKNKKALITIMVGLIVGSAAYWFQPYNQTTVLGINIWLLTSLGAFAGSFVLVILLKSKPSTTAMILSFGVLIAVFGRIFYDISFYSSRSHNLFPFEIILMALITFPSAFIGAFTSQLVKLLIDKTIKQ